MSLALIIYLASLSTGIGVVSLLGAFICVVVSVILLGLHFDDNLNPHGMKILKRLIISAVICITLSILIPDEKTIYLIVAANGVTDIAKTPEADKARQALNIGLDKIINNLQESK